MVARRRWRDLNRRTRQLIIFGGAFEAVLKVIALIDLKRRPAIEIRGSKRRWAVAISLVNSVGAVPTAYLLYGRNQPSRRELAPPTD